MEKLSQFISRVTSSSTQSFYWGFILFFTLVHIVIYVIMPYTCDDYWYMTSLIDYCKGIDTSFPFESLQRCWMEHYATDNIRLANIIFTLTLLLPKFIPSILSGLFVGVILWQSTKLSRISWRNPFLFIILAFGLTFMLPWYEQMFTQCFALNYIWATMLTLMLAIRFWSDKKQNIYLSILLGLVVGAWHEGFSVPLLAGFVVYTILNRREINHQHVMIIGAMIIGFIWLLNAPGLQANIGYKTKSVQLSSIVSKLMLYHIPLFVLILSILKVSLKKKTRVLILDPIFISFVAISFVGVVLNLMTDVGVRTGWMGILFAMIATIYLWENMKGVGHEQNKSMIKRCVIIATSLILVIHFIVAMNYTMEVRKEVNYVMEQYNKSSDGQVFANVIYDYQAPIIAWKKPYFEIFTYNWAMYWKDQYFSNGTKQMRVIPTCLSDAEMLRAEKVKGDNPFYIFNGYLYAPVGYGGYVEKEVVYDIDRRVLTDPPVPTTNY